MKQLIILIILIGVSQFSFSQSACDKWKQIQGKSESDFTDVKRLKIYWSKRCACESGQITGGTWDYTVELVNSNYEMYHERRDKFPSEYSYSGPLVPDRKISVNECNSDNNLHINDEGNTNCDHKAFNSTQDPQNFANDFMRARCQCLEGVAFEEDAKKLAATMQINHKNIKTYYGNSFQIADPLPWTACPILEFGGEGMKNSAPNQNKLIKDSHLEILNMLNENVDNELINETTEDLNYLRDFGNNLRANYPDQMAKVDEIESVAMAVSIGANILESIFSKKKDTDVVTDPDPVKSYWVNQEVVLLRDSERKNYPIRLPIPPSIEDLKFFQQEANKLLNLDKMNEAVQPIWDNFIKESKALIDPDSLNEYRKNIHLARIQNKKGEELKYRKLFIKNFRNETPWNKYLQESTKVAAKYSNPMSKEIIDELLIRYWLRGNPDWTSKEMRKYLKEHTYHFTDRIDLNSFDRESQERIDRKNKLSKSLFNEIMLIPSFDNYLAEMYLPLYYLTRVKSISTNLVINYKDNSTDLYPHAKRFDSTDVFYVVNIFENKAEQYDNFGYCSVDGFMDEHHFMYSQYFTLLALNQLNHPSDTLTGLKLYNSMMRTRLLRREDKRQNNEVDGGIELLYASFLRNIGDFDGHQKQMQKVTSNLYKVYPKQKVDFPTFLSSYQEFKDCKKCQKKVLHPVWHEAIDPIRNCRMLPYLVQENMLLNIAQKNIQEEDLQAISTIIEIFETELLNRNILLLNDYNVGSHAASYEDKLSDHYHKGFSSFYLYRYYLGLKLNKPEHREHDAKYIQENLVYVLEDYVRNTTNFEPAQVVLKHLGIIE